MKGEPMTEEHHVAIPQDPGDGGDGGRAVRDHSRAVVDEAHPDASRNKRRWPVNVSARHLADLRRNAIEGARPR